MIGPIRKGKDKSNKKCALTAMIVRFGKAHFNLLKRLTTFSILHYGAKTDG